MAAKILVADDDPHIGEVLSFALEQAGYDVHVVVNGALALAACEKQKYDLLILDIMMPEMDGTEVCRRLRQGSAHTSLPIVFLTSRTDEIDRIVGLELGGDDYVNKPFSPRELVARVKAVLRRFESAAAVATGVTNDDALSYEGLELDTTAYTAKWQGQQLELTATEFGILRTLIARPGKVYSRDELMTGAYNVHKVVSDRTIDSHVRRVRGKLAAAGGDPIRTVHGIGYTLGKSQG